MELTFNELVVKQSHITTIHLLEDKVYGTRTDFNTLDSYDLFQLEHYRDSLVTVYNANINKVGA